MAASANIEWRIFICCARLSMGQQLRFDSRADTKHTLANKAPLFLALALQLSAAIDRCLVSSFCVPPIARTKGLAGALRLTS